MTDSPNLTPVNFSPQIRLKSDRDKILFKGTLDDLLVYGFDVARPDARDTIGSGKLVEHGVTKRLGQTRSGGNCRPLHQLFL